MFLVFTLIRYAVGLLKYKATHWALILWMIYAIVKGVIQHGFPF